MIFAAALLALAVPVRAVAADFLNPDDRAAASFSTTSVHPGQATGLTASIQWRDPATEGGKPPTVQNVSFVLPQGMTIDSAALTQCAASDQQLTLQGVDACPAESRVGSGTLVGDNGAPDGGPPRYVNYTLTAFNGNGEILILADSTGSPSRAVIHATIANGTVSADFPVLPGGPGPDPLLAFKSFDLTILPLVAGGVAYVSTPPSCSAGYWEGTFAFTYRDTTQQQLTTSTPCQPPPPPPPPPSHRKPRISVSGMPAGHCTKGSFAVTVRISAAGTPRLVAVFFDGRKAGTTQQTRFRLRIHSEGLPSGVHRLGLKVVGQNGRKATLLAKFRRC
jgi:hypothetical protein